MFNSLILADWSLFCKWRVNGLTDGRTNVSTDWWMNGAKTHRDGCQAFSDESKGSLRAETSVTTSWGEWGRRGIYDTNDLVFQSERFHNVPRRQGECVSAGTDGRTYVCPSPYLKRVQKKLKDEEETILRAPSLWLHWFGSRTVTTTTTNSEMRSRLELVDSTRSPNWGKE